MKRVSKKWCLIGMGAAVVAVSSSPAIAGQKVTADDMAQFKVGIASYQDVTGRLGRPRTIESLSDGSKTIRYSTVKRHYKAVGFVPVVGLFTGAGPKDVLIVSFTFDGNDVLTKAWASDTHEDCRTVFGIQQCGQW